MLTKKKSQISKSNGTKSFGVFNNNSYDDPNFSDGGDSDSDNGSEIKSFGITTYTISISSITMESIEDRLLRAITSRDYTKDDFYEFYYLIEIIIIIEEEFNIRIPDSVAEGTTFEKILAYLKTIFYF